MRTTNNRPVLTTIGGRLARSGGVRLQGKRNREVVPEYTVCDEESNDVHEDDRDDELMADYHNYNAKTNEIVDDGLEASLLRQDDELRLLENRQGQDDDDAQRDGQQRRDPNEERRNKNDGEGEGSGIGIVYYYGALQPGSAVRIRTGTDLSLARKAWKKRRRSGSPLLIPCSVLHVDLAEALRGNLLYLLQKYGTCTTTLMSTTSTSVGGGPVLEMSFEELRRRHGQQFKCSLERVATHLGYWNDDDINDDEEEETDNDEEDGENNSGTSSSLEAFLTSHVWTRRAQDFYGVQWMRQQQRGGEEQQGSSSYYSLRTLRSRMSAQKRANAAVVVQGTLPRPPSSSSAEDTDNNNDRFASDDNEVSNNRNDDNDNEEGEETTLQQQRQAEDEPPVLLHTGMVRNKIKRRNSKQAEHSNDNVATFEAAAAENGNNNKYADAPPRQQRQQRRISYRLEPLSAALRIGPDGGNNSGGNKNEMMISAVRPDTEYSAVVFDYDPAGDGGAPLLIASLTPPRSVVDARRRLRARQQQQQQQQRRQQVGRGDRRDDHHQPQQQQGQEREQEQRQQHHEEVETTQELSLSDLRVGHGPLQGTVVRFVKGGVFVDCGVVGGGGQTTDTTTTATVATTCSRRRRLGFLAFQDAKVVREAAAQPRKRAADAPGQRQTFLRPYRLSVGDRIPVYIRSLSTKQVGNDQYTLTMHRTSPTLLHATNDETLSPAQVKREQTLDKKTKRLAKQLRDALLFSSVDDSYDEGPNTLLDATSISSLGGGVAVGAVEEEAILEECLAMIEGLECNGIVQATSNKASSSSSSGGSKNLLYVKPQLQAKPINNGARRRQQQQRQEQQKTLLDLPVGVATFWENDGGEGDNGVGHTTRGQQGEEENKEEKGEVVEGTATTMLSAKDFSRGDVVRVRLEGLDRTRGQLAMRVLRKLSP